MNHEFVIELKRRARCPPLLSPLVRVELFDVDEAEAARRLLAAARGPARPDNKPGFPGHGQTGMLTGQSAAGPRLPGGLPRVWNVGPRNPGFVGRDGMLAHLRGRLRSGGTAVVQALHGMGGVGKTQMAIEYAHRHAGAYDVVWWISAEETSLIGEQFAALAFELDLASPHAGTASAVGALHAYLRGHSRWLGEFEAARERGEDTLARARRVFGDDHPHARKAANNLAIVRRLLGEADSDPTDES